MSHTEDLRRMQDTEHHAWHPRGRYPDSCFACSKESVIELVAENEDLKQEIQRHHKDFARWEAMADKGASRIDENKQLTADNERLQHRLFPAQGEDYDNEVERLRSVVDGLQVTSQKLRDENEQLKDRNQKLIDFVLKFRYNFQREIDYANLYEEADDILGMGLYPFDEDIEDLYCEESNDE